MPATRLRTGAMIPPASATPISNAPSSACRADDRRSATAACAAAPALRRRTLHQREQRLRQIRLDRHDQRQERLVLGREWRRQRVFVRQQRSSGGRRRNDATPLARRPGRCEHAILRQERHVRAVSSPSAAPRPVVDASPEQQESDHVGRRTPARHELEQLTVDLGDAGRRLFGVDRLLQRRQRRLECLAAASFSGRCREHTCRVRRDPQELDADALLLALARRTRASPPRSRRIEMGRDHALQREIARQQDGIRLQARGALLQQRLEDLPVVSSCGPACASPRATDDELREARTSPAARRGSAPRTRGRSSVRRRPRSPPFIGLAPCAAHRGARARGRKRQLEGELRIAAADSRRLRDVFRSSLALRVPRHDVYLPALGGRRLNAPSSSVTREAWRSAARG